MALIVRSGVDQLRIEEMNQRTARRVAEGLVAEGCSFYSEPMPFERVTIWVDQEHLPTVHRLMRSRIVTPSAGVKL